MNQKTRQILIYIAVMVMVVLAAVWWITRIRQPDTPRKKYSEIVQEFKDGRVESFEFNLGNGRLAYYLKEEYAENEADKKEKVYRVPSVNLFLTDVYHGIILPISYDNTGDGNISGTDNTNTNSGIISNNDPGSGIEFDFIPASDNTLLFTFVPYLLLIAVMVIIFFTMMRQSGSKIGQFGKMNYNKNLADRGRKTKFNEVAGADEEKQELNEIVEFLRNPGKYNDLGARIPKGVLLVGPPGTGKTLLARAVAGEASVAFFAISGSDFVETFVGVGASRVRDIFEQAKKNSPSIIFIDEIDAVGRQRGAGLGGGHDEREQTLNQLLVEMDGFGTNEGVVVMAATNRRDILDPALLRPGRFDRQVYVNYPDAKGREEILKVHSKNKPLGFDVDLEVIAKTTAGFTGADLENLMNEAALLAARNNHKSLTASDIESAMFKVVIGPEKKSRKVIAREKKLTAFHEAGHAIATFHCSTKDPVHHISIIPRGMAGGFTLSLPEQDKTYRTKREMQEDIVVFMGGRVAESLLMDDISSGASNDIERATAIARKMVTAYGFSEKLGTVTYGQGDHEVFLGRDYTSAKVVSEQVKAQIDAEIRDIIDSAYSRCKEILESELEKLDILGKYLYVNEKCDAETFLKVMDNEISKEEIEREAQKLEEKINEIQEAAEGNVE
ncbi:MAG: ATP-dependent zinc metalloprotease FtsH [Oscillospiraceae bacterium]|nr:ATP-dependent zinc metalloprotease FtsH [Oscillospiraceae bacterium]